MRRIIGATALAATLLLLSGCSSTTTQIKPADIWVRIKQIGAAVEACVDAAQGAYREHEPVLSDSETSGGESARPGAALAESATSGAEE